MKLSWRRKTFCISLNGLRCIKRRERVHIEAFHLQWCWVIDTIMRLEQIMDFMTRPLAEEHSIFHRGFDLSDGVSMLESLTSMNYRLGSYKMSTRKPRGLASWMNRKNKYEKR